MLIGLIGQYIVITNVIIQFFLTYLFTSLAWPDPLPHRAFITCSISTRAPEGLVEVTDLTSSKATSFQWAIICFNFVKVTKGIVRLKY